MNNTKKINVNFSSLVGLKTELLRKQHEVNEAKLKSETTQVDLKLKKKFKKVKKKNVDRNLDKSEYIEDVSTHKKSKLMLEAKARLYKQLKRSRTNNDNFLVDFKSKSDESEEEISQKEEDNENDVTFGNEDDWVEYEDCFGRTRKCLREDLPLMQEKDKLVKQQIVNEKGIDSKTKDNVEQSIIEDEKEPEIEIMRRKWEEQTKKLADKANIHYQDVLFDEARTHGVGYYAFSQSEEERMKQQENLLNLRKETERKQKEIKELKDLREKMEYNRLKAARIRQRIRAGLPVDTIEEEEEEFKQKNDNESNQDKVESESSTHAEEKPVEMNDNKEKEGNEEDEAVIKENKIKALGELLGKRTHWYEMSQEEWVDKCRKERVTEFAPVYSNFKSGGYLNSENTDESSNHQEHQKSNSDQMLIQNDEIDLDSYYIPLPPTLETNSSTAKCDKNTLIRKKDNDHSSHQTIDTTQYESNNIIEDQVKPTANIDEESILAGLRYLREKFEESQNS
ncbi:coiled-coil domain-containing protein 174 [Osmia bicornis bicornis]|uniref:coiled-coil domain-containing protein 174 n=1 Tax=Osmia bicornis bicornis TaxID=1437191 RepID=UPI0010F8792A|nr:coiled-coil domain-containing protein 174 [Osmia bicornis bicornis]